MTQPPELDADTKARIAAEEAYRARLNGSQNNAPVQPKQKGGCWKIGCGGLLGLLGLFVLVGTIGNSLGGEKAGSKGSSLSASIAQDTWGCRTKEAFNRISQAKAQGDSNATADLLQQFLQDNECVLLNNGESVVLVDNSLHEGMTMIHKLNDSQSYWTYFEAVKMR